MKKFEMTVEIDVEDIEILSGIVIPGIEFFELCSISVPVTVKVADGDGNVTSQICVVHTENSMIIHDGEKEISMKISEFMKHVNLDSWKMADICVNQTVIDEAQNHWIYG